jgi:soluble lytic murein transglycosylase
MEFLKALFKFGAAVQAGPYIRSYENFLSVQELRSLAAELEEAGYFSESLNLISRYMAREDFRIEEGDDTRAWFPLSREDLNLFYPRPFRELIEKYAQDAGIAPGLLFALIRTESYFMPEVVSHAGAVGLSQLMPATALEMAGRIARRSGEEGPLPDYRIDGTIDLKNPEINVHIGSFYLNYLFNLMDHPLTAVLAYNGGLGRVRRWRAANDLPVDLFLETIEFAETREYGRRVLGAAAVYGYLYYGLSMDEVIADIYSQGN